MNKIIPLRLNAFAAGFLIGLGVVINTLAPDPVLGAILFGFGLLTIIQLQIPLYTGQIGFLQNRLENKTAYDLIPILIYNFLGILFCIGIAQFQNPTFKQIFINKAILKFDKSYLKLLMDGVLCGSLIHFAVKCKKQLLTIMAVAIFILIGAEHCVADFPYYCMNLSLINTLKFFMVIIGNSLGAILIENLLIK